MLTDSSEDSESAESSVVGFFFVATFLSCFSCFFCSRFNAAAYMSNFPLDAALRANMGASWAERATSFLRTQTGARSLEPREGNAPDAILSRAEAALASGDLVVTLAEITTLPAEAQPALAEWRVIAETRLAAALAVADLAATIGKWGRR